MVEESLRRKNMPYKIFQGHSFYERAEVKDLLAYLRLVANEKDDEAFKRVINFPTRGIGKTSLDRLIEGARTKDCSLSNLVYTEDLENYGIKGATGNKIKSFVNAIAQVRSKIHTSNAFDIALEINNKFGIIDFMRLDTTLEAQGRVENVEELFNSIKEFVEEGEAEYENIAEEGYEAPLITLRSGRAHV